MNTSNKKIKSYCPECGKKWMISETTIGRRVRCKSCQNFVYFYPDLDGIEKDIDELRNEIVPQKIALPVKIVQRQCFFCSQPMQINAALESTKLLCRSCSNEQEFSYGELQKENLYQKVELANIIETRYSKIDISKTRDLLSNYKLPKNIRPQNRCKMCGYSWVPRGKNLSLSCPKCNDSNVYMLWQPLKKRQSDITFNENFTSQSIQNQWYECVDSVLPEGVQFDRNEIIFGIPYQQGLWFLDIVLKLLTLDSKIITSNPIRLVFDTETLPDWANPRILNILEIQHPRILELQPVKLNINHRVTKHRKKKKVEYVPLLSKSGIPRNRCASCGHHWTPRGQNLSKKCPNCGRRSVTYVMVPKQNFPILSCVILLAIAIIIFAYLYSASMN